MQDLPFVRNVHAKDMTKLQHNPSRLHSVALPEEICSCMPFPLMEHIFGFILHG